MRGYGRNWLWQFLRCEPRVGTLFILYSAQRQPRNSLWRLSMTDCHGGYARTCWERISEANGERSAIKVKERVKAACGLYPRVWEAGAVSRWISLRTWSCGGVHGTEPRTGQQHCIEPVDFDADAQTGCEPQNGQYGSCRSNKRASKIRSVAIE